MQLKSIPLCTVSNISSGIFIRHDPVSGPRDTQNNFLPAACIMVASADESQPIMLNREQFRSPVARSGSPELCASFELRAATEVYSSCEEKSGLYNEWKDYCAAGRCNRKGYREQQRGTGESYYASLACE